jgi:hypothetical protein
MKRHLLRFGSVAVAALVILFSASLLQARQGVVKTRDGKTLEGDIDEKPDQVVIVMHGIKTTINRDNVGEVEYFDNVEARYKAKVAALPKKPTVADHLNLARWLLDVKSYDLALQEIDEARKIDANSAEAQTLEATVMSQRRLDRNKPAAGTGTNPGTAVTPTNPGNDVKPAPGDKKYLTPEDINTIRETEWREKDTVVPRAVVPPDVRKRYVNLKALDPGQFAALSMPQQAYYILIDRDAPDEMKREIKLTTDPQALVEYRRVIQPLVVNNCATTGCHGGKNAGRFFLFNNNVERDEVAYTNFFILNWYQQKFGDKVYSMIDRTYPERSILANFALHPDSSELKHPELKGQTYKPIAANKSSPNYKTIVTWMKGLQAQDPNSSAKTDTPENHTAYHIDYTPPRSSPKKVDEGAGDAPKTDAPKTGAGAGTGAGTVPAK